MTQSPDDPTDPADGGTGGNEPGAGRKLDEDAAWRDIVANYGDPPPMGPETPAPPAAEEEPRSVRDERLRGLFRPAWSDPHDTEATWEDEGHFVPPDPPPPPRPEPRRRAAWLGLFGSPTLMLVSVVLGWTLPAWVTAGLAAGFVGGFVYLVATMPNRAGDGSGGNGAVV